MKENRCAALRVTPSITLYHAGPALDHGPLPSLFYFAISGPDSLCLDPFNQPVQFLQGKMIRIFSMTLPGHEEGLSPHGAMKIWAEDLEKKTNTLPRFLDSLETAIEFGIREKFIDPKQMAAMGLSRGAFIAAHIAAREKRFRSLVCFAPLTNLLKIREFASFPHPESAQELSLSSLAPKLGDRRVKIFIGNEDTRVDTRSCFDFAMQLVAHKSQRTSPVELLIYPSIGQMGHGTPPEIFKKGVESLFPCP